MSTVDPRLPQYPVQLHHARLYSARLVRRRREATDAEGPGLDFGVRTHAVREDRRGLSVLVGATVTIPLLAETVTSIECAIDGAFVSDDPLTDDFVREFIGAAATVILWPYLRAAVGELARMAEVDASPLPTLDVLNMLAADRVAAEPPSGSPAKRTAKPRTARATRT